MEKVIPIPGRMYGPGGNIDTEKAMIFATNLPAFKKWVEKLAANYGENLTEIAILDVYPFGPYTSTRGFVMANVKATKGGRPVSGFALIRGGAVCVLVILQDEAGQEYVVTTLQPRVPGGEINYEEIPAGMLDAATDKFASVATKELEEELHFKIKSSDLVKLSDMYPSIGGCDEMITAFVYRARMSKVSIDEFKGKHTGEPSENEQIVTKLRTYDEFKAACRNGEITDAKAQLTLGLYEMLKAERGADAVPLVDAEANLLQGGGRKKSTRKHKRRQTKTRKH